MDNFTPNRSIEAIMQESRRRLAELDAERRYNRNVLIAIFVLGLLATAIHLAIFFGV